MNWLMGWLRNRVWFGYWWWCSFCSAHGQGHYRHACRQCRVGHWVDGSSNVPDEDDDSPEQQSVKP